MFAHGDPEAMVDPSGNISLIESLHTTALNGAMRYAQALQRWEKVGDPAIKAIGSLWVGINLAASWESLYRFQIPELRGTMSRGSHLQWIKQGASLFRALPHQGQLVKKFRKLVDQKSTITFGTTLKNFTDLSIQYSKSLMSRPQWRGKIYQKMNGLPEFTPYTIGARSVFIKGGWEPDGEKVGLTGVRETDKSLAGSVGFTKEPSTWHHHEVMGIMQLVPSSLNNTRSGGVPHAGGTAFWQLMKNTKYK